MAVPVKAKFLWFSDLRSWYVLTGDVEFWLPRTAGQCGYAPWCTYSGICFAPDFDWADELNAMR